METKESKNINNIEESKEKKIKSILNKIQHKPIIMESIYSFSQNRPYILLYLISNDDSLKSSLKDTFDNAKKNNNLSKEINMNINNYIAYRKIIEKLKEKHEEIKTDIFKRNEKLNSLIQKSNDINEKSQKEFLEHIIKKKLIKPNFIDKDYYIVEKCIKDLYFSSYKREKRESNNIDKLKKYKITKNTDIDKKFYEIDPNFFNSIIKEELKRKENKNNIIFREKTKELLIHMSYYEYCRNDLMINKYFDCLDKKGKELFLDNIFYFHDFDYLEIFQSFFKIMPFSTKKYRESYKESVNTKLNKEGDYLYKEKIKKQSIIYEIINKYTDFFTNNCYDLNKIISLYFDYLTTFDKIFLYNIPKGNNDDIIYNIKNNFLDEKYLKYASDNNLKQKICLGCIIDRYKYSEYINNIIYPYINELYFSLFSNIFFNENFMFTDIPINDIYSIFITYFLTIKNYQNIEKISFGNEFCLNKNQFLSYNDEYYQSIISYLIDQYLINYNNTENNVLEKNKIKNIELNVDNLNNIYEKYKIIYGFNKMFPNLENKKILEISYEDMINNTYNNINDNKSYYEIIEVNFEQKEIKEDINSIINNVTNFIKQNLSKYINNIKIISFINFTCEIINNKNIISYNFDELKDLEEFFINNNKNKLGNINNLKFNQFKYEYYGYDINDNLVYYRNGKNAIKSTDLLDLFNLFNNKIIKIYFNHENIEIIHNKEKSQLKIINLNKDSYRHQINNLSDYIKNIKNLNDLIIEGFDFSFEEIQNQYIKKLSVNYDINCDQLFGYDVKALEQTNYFISKDINMKQKFPNLEEINIGNLRNENILYDNLFKAVNFNSNLKTINIISYQNYKIKKMNTKLKINIISKRKELSNKKENEEEENSNDYRDEEDEYDDYYDEDNDLFIDQYEDILKNENPVVNNPINIKKKKIKNEISIKKEENTEKKETGKIILIREKIKPYKKIEENIFKKDIKSYLKKEKILYFNSKIIQTVNQFYLIQYSLLLIESNIDINKIEFKQLLIPKNDFSYEFYKQCKKTKNLFIVFEIFEIDSTEIICIFSKNKIPNQKENNFCLFINKNEVHLHMKEKKKNKKYFKSDILERNEFESFDSHGKNNLIKMFFEDENFDEYNYNSEAFIEIYEINFNN